VISDDNNNYIGSQTYTHNTYVVYIIINYYYTTCSMYTCTWVVILVGFVAANVVRG